MSKEIQLSLMTENSIETGDFLREVREIYNSNAEKLNNLLYGYRDYCLIAKK